MGRRRRRHAESGSAPRPRAVARRARMVSGRPHPGGAGRRRDHRSPVARPRARGPSRARRRLGGRRRLDGAGDARDGRGLPPPAPRGVGAARASRPSGRGPTDRSRCGQRHRRRDPIAARTSPALRRRRAPARDVQGEGGHRAAAAAVGDRPRRAQQVRPPRWDRAAEGHADRHRPARPFPRGVARRSAAAGQSRRARGPGERRDPGDRAPRLGRGGTRRVRLDAAVHAGSGTAPEARNDGRQPTGDPRPARGPRSRSRHGRPGRRRWRMPATIRSPG